MDFVLVFVSRLSVYAFYHTILFERSATLLHFAQPTVEFSLFAGIFRVKIVFYLFISSNSSLDESVLG